MTTIRHYELRFWAWMEQIVIALKRRHWISRRRALALFARIDEHLRRHHCHHRTVG
ncbi:MAG: hypothetical protein JOY64_17615 [Alphaproteobacteria bacterium]|nr:hypothetical protein [Alphaproteobacteria bacterium]MBV8409451.1 hypothetical protein [Alphaproteobacteria bacterium]